MKHTTRGRQYCTRLGRSGGGGGGGGCGGVVGDVDEGGEVTSDAARARAARAQAGPSAASRPRRALTARARSGAQPRVRADQLVEERLLRALRQWADDHALREALQRGAQQRGGVGVGLGQAVNLGAGGGGGGGRAREARRGLRAGRGVAVGERGGARRREAARGGARRREATGRAGGARGLGGGATRGAHGAGAMLTPTSSSSAERGRSAATGALARGGPAAAPPRGVGPRPPVAAEPPGGPSRWVGARQEAANSSSLSCGIGRGKCQCGRDCGGCARRGVLGVRGDRSFRARKKSTNRISDHCTSTKSVQPPEPANPRYRVQ